MVKMSNYYLLGSKEKSEVASAFTAQNNLLDKELISQLEGKSQLPFCFELKKIRQGINGLVIDDDLSNLSEVWLDYQPNNLAWPLMSEALKSVIDKNLTGEEHVDWISCDIMYQQEKKTYYILRFNKLLDVLDLNKSLFVKGTDSIIRPVLALNKVNNFSVFMVSTAGYGNLWKITPGVYINEILKKAIQKHKLTGMQFDKVSVS